MENQEQPGFQERSDALNVKADNTDPSAKCSANSEILHNQLHSLNDATA